MQPAKFTLRETQIVSHIKIVKNKIDSRASTALVIVSSAVEERLDAISDMNESASTSLVGASSVDQPLGNGSDFNQSDQNQLTCSYTDPCTSKTCLWLQPVQEHACLNLTASSALVWTRVTPGLFRTTLMFIASKAMAGKYDFTLHLPLKAKGPYATSEYSNMSIKVNVMAWTCASSSAICFENKDSSGSCSSLSNEITYKQWDKLQVRVSHLRDVNGLLIPSQAVDNAAAMTLTLCTPRAQSQCTETHMKYHQEDGRFSADLSRLTHAGRHGVKIAHGNMTACLWSASFVVSCKVGYTGRPRHTVGLTLHTLGLTVHIVGLTLHTLGLASIHSASPSIHSASPSIQSASPSIHSGSPSIHSASPSIHSA